MSQNLALVLAGAALVPLLLGGLPIAFSLLAASLLYFVLAGADPSIVGSNMFWFLNKSELVAIPFFILAADLLGRSRATNDLVAAADLAFGRLAGGLALVTMVATIVFSAIAGSSVATAIAIGRVMIPKLVEAGYPQRFAVGLVAAGGGLGILVPPSVPLIIYATGRRNLGRRRLRGRDRTGADAGTGVLRLHHDLRRARPTPAAAHVA